MKIHHKQQKISWVWAIRITKDFSLCWGGNWSLGCNGTTGFRSRWMITGENWRANGEWSQRNWFRWKSNVKSWTNLWTVQEFRKIGLLAVHFLLVGLMVMGEEYVLEEVAQVIPLAELNWVNHENSTSLSPRRFLRLEQGIFWFTCLVNPSSAKS